MEDRFDRERGERGRLTCHADQSIDNLNPQSHPSSDRWLFCWACEMRSVVACAPADGDADEDEDAEGSPQDGKSFEAEDPGVSAVGRSAYESEEKDDRGGEGEAGQDDAVPRVLAEHSNEVAEGAGVPGVGGAVVVWFGQGESRSRKTNGKGTKAVALRPLGWSSVKRWLSIAGDVRARRTRRV